MKGVVITNGYYESASSVHQAERTWQELKSLGAEVAIIKNDQVYSIGTKAPDNTGAFSSKNVDFAIFYDKDINLARHLENQGIRVYNPSSAIEDADDKIRTAELLAHNGVPVPLTIPAPKRYADAVDKGFLQKVADTLGFPMVFKLARGSLGREVFLVEDMAELIALDKKYSTSDRLYQKYVAASRGRSYRVIVVGGKYLCAMRLRNDVDFRSNAAQGGSAENAELTQEYIDVAERAAKALKCDYCGVDLFCHEPVVIELNSNAYFMTMENVSGVNVARNYAEYVLGRKS